jgi:putative ABC transport system permease protein
MLRDVRGIRWFDEVTQDARGAVRILRATPIVSAAAILSLALGIGANAAIFSLVNRLVWRTLPVAEPQRLFTLESGHALNAGDGPRWSSALWREVHQQAGRFAGMAAWSAARFNIGEGSDIDPVDGLIASGDVFATLGVPAALGRTFTPADDVRGGGREGAVAVLSYGFWQRRFAGATDVIGRRLIVEHAPFTIIGVAARTFTGVEAGRGFDVAVPIGAEPLIRGRQSFLSPPLDRFNYWLLVVLRLKAGQSVDAATAALRAVQPQIRDRSVPREFPQLRDTYLKEPFTLAPAGSGFSRLRQLYQRPLLIIFGVVAFVLLIACANIANLLLARAAARQHEWSVRLALGASRGRLARQLMIESLVLAAIGSAAGLLVARWSSDGLVKQLSTPTSPVVLDVSLDWRVLAFTAGVMVVTALLFGTAPAFRAAAAPPISALKDPGRTSWRLSGTKLSNALVILQVALSLALVVGAGLLVSTFERLAHIPLGFDSRHVLLVTADATRTNIKAADRREFYGRLVSDVTTMPGVASAAASVATPAGATNLFPIWVRSVNGSPVAAAAGQSAKANFITPRWFATYATPLLAGRDFDAHDLSSAARVVIVNGAFARQFLPNGHAIGNPVDLAFGGHGEIPGGVRTVVGIAGNAVADSLREPPPPTVYLPLAQWDFPIPMSPVIGLSIRARAGSPSAIAGHVRAALASMDDHLALRIRPLDDQIDASLARERTVALLAGFFGALALLLAGVGLYGVMAYTITRRRAEMAIRMALGASPRSVVRLVLSHAALIVGAGVAVGAVGSLWLSRYLAALLYGIKGNDPRFLAGAIVVLAAVSMFAGWLPARRASHVDPAVVLREG